MKSATVFDATVKVISVMQADSLPTLEAARTALSELNRLVDYPCLEIAEWDPVVGRHQPLHAEHFPAKLLEGLNGSVFLDDLSWPALHRDRRPKGWSDIDDIVDRRESSLYQDFILPLGYREGIYLPLFHRDRYVGMVTGNTDSAKLPGALEKEALSAAAPVLGEFVFRVGARRLHREADGTVLLDSELNVLSLDPEQDATTAERIRSVLRRAWPTHGQVARFAIWSEDMRSPIRVQVQNAWQGAGRYYVSWRVGDLPAGLSRRQTEVITGIVEGLSNAAIGERLFTSPRTISKHVENILIKLGVPNRSAVTRLAVMEGIYLLDHPTLIRHT